MSTLITRFFEAILDVSAFIIIVACFLGGMAVGTAGTNRLAIGIVGAVIGLFASAIVLGIPMLLFRINRNLEAIQALLAASESGGQAGVRARIEPR